MKDFEGKQLSVGDSVAFISTFFKRLERGTVVGFTPTMIRVQTSYGAGIVNRKPEYTVKL